MRSLPGAAMVNMRAPQSVSAMSSRICAPRFRTASYTSSALSASMTRSAAGNPWPKPTSTPASGAWNFAPRLRVPSHDSPLVSPSCSKNSSRAWYSRSLEGTISLWIERIKQEKTYHRDTETREFNGEWRNCLLWPSGEFKCYQSAFANHHSRRSPSLSLELRCALFEECSGSFPFVFGGAAHGEQRGFQEQTFSQGHFHPAVHRFHGVLHRQRGVGDDLVGNCFGAGDEVRLGDYFIDQADAVRLLGSDHLAAEDELHGQTLAYQARQALRASIAGNDAQLHFRLAQ